MPEPATIPTATLRGFSLIELVLVVAIIAVLSAIAIPRYGNSLDRYRVEAAAGRIIADLAYARSKAEATSISKTVEFDAADDKYTLVGIPRLDGQPGDYVVELGDESYQTTITSVDFDGGLVTFDGYGMPDSSGSITISVGTQSRTVALDQNTGRAEMQ